MKPLPLMTPAELDAHMAETDERALADREAGIPVRADVLCRGEQAAAEVSRRKRRAA